MSIEQAGKDDSEIEKSSFSEHSSDNNDDQDAGNGALNKDA